MLLPPTPHHLEFLTVSTREYTYPFTTQIFNFLIRELKL